MKNAGLLLFCTFAVIIFLALPGCNNDKIQPGSSDTDKGKGPRLQQTATVAQKEITPVYEAIGTVRPLTESVIESQVTAQVIKVLCQPGTPVNAGQVLINLDARQLNARLAQAKEGLNQAKSNLEQIKKAMEEAGATLEQAQSAYNRSVKLFESKIISSQQFEKDKSAYLAARARLEGTQKAIQSAESSIRNAREVVKEAKIALDYTQLLAPAKGVVVRRLVDPGDLAVPGKPLLMIQTSGAMRLEANVREGMIGFVELGKTYPVKIANIHEELSSQVDQIVPYADPGTRTFLVKTLLPDTQGVYPGMFGRLLIPMEKTVTLTIPEKAVYRIGQLEMVFVKRADAWKKIYIKTGKTFGSDIEVLSGLSADETIGYESK